MNNGVAVSEVEQVLINKDGAPLRPSKGMDDDSTELYSTNIAQLVAKTIDLVPEELVTLWRGNSVTRGYNMVADNELKQVTMDNPKANLR